MTPRHEQALALAAGGIPVFPCLPDGKEPATLHSFDDATTDPDIINAWWAEADYNLAICPESAGWAVVDLDGQEGSDAWTALTEEKPPTYSVRTASGGTHLYFLGTLPPSVRKLGPGIDTRGRRSYVLVPPSVVDGKPYSVSANAEVAAIPAWISSMLETRAEPRAAPPELNVDPAEVEQRARTYLESLVAQGKVSVEGAGGDNRLIGTCFFLRDLGCTPEQALALLLEVWNPHCRPPWSEDELGVKIKNASQYAQNEAGAYASTPPEQAFSVYLESLKPALPLPEPQALGDLDDDEKPVETVVDGWVQKHRLNIFRGRGGANKSRLALQWLLLVDAGTSCAGFTVQKAQGLYLSCEDDEDEVKRRRNAISKKLGLNRSNVLYFDMTDEDDAFLLVATDMDGVLKTPKWTDLARRLKDIPGHKFVVFDSTYDVIDFRGSTKNSDTHVRMVIRMFDRMCRDCDATMVTLWHPSRAGMGRGDEGGFSTAWDNAPRNAISIKPLEDGTFSLQAEKRNNFAPGLPLILRWADGAMIPVVGDEATQIMEHEAVVEIAMQADMAHQPISKRGKPVKWIFDEIEKLAGRPMGMADIRNALADECRRKDARLTYRNHDPHGRGDPAGWVSSTLEGKDK